MQISLKWLNELVNLNTIQLDDLIEKLTLGGFEVEEVLEIEINDQKQIALEISATANRSDSLSIQGISIEIASLLNQSNTISNYSTEFKKWKETILSYSTPLKPEYDCSILSSVIITNLVDHKVPKWITKKLINSGIIPENNLTDFQNYLLLETGYPFAFYDFEKINSKLHNTKFELSVSKALNDQQFLAANNNTYKLNNSILLVKANEIPISIAGISENREFIISKTTTSILIEGSIFNAAKIRQQSRTLGLRTDRSTRYEKSIKNTYLFEAFYRLILLLRISNSNLNCTLQTIAKVSEDSPKPIRLRYDKINEILGPIAQFSNGKVEYLNSEKIENYLKRLNFTFSSDIKKQNWEVTIPHFRTEDLTREIDLIEEIGRLHGFNNFLITLPELKKIGEEDISYKTRKKLTSCLLNLGFNELIHYSLVNETTIINNKIKLLNPLVSDYSSLRASLLPNLIKTLEDNLKQGNPMINGFEYGHVFLPNIQQKFTEKEFLAGIFGGLKTKLTWSEPENALNWFEAKGKLEQLFNQLNIIVNWQNNADSNKIQILHPYRNAELLLKNETKLGIFGQINPILANQLTISSDIYMFELNMEVLQNEMQVNQLAQYQEYSLYPKIVKDISFIIQKNITFNELKKILYSNGTEILSEIKLLDEYKGKSIPKDHISLCLQLTFQSTEKTLQNKEIEEILKNIQFLLTKKFNAIIRD
nr:phenylalanine tRNA synthetase [Schizostauron trachyderma]